MCFSDFSVFVRSENMACIKIILLTLMKHTFGHRCWSIFISVLCLLEKKKKVYSLLHWIKPVNHFISHYPVQENRNHTGYFELSWAYLMQKFASTVLQELEEQKGEGDITRAKSVTFVPGCPATELRC